MLYSSQSEGQIPLELLEMKLEQQIKAKVAKGLQVHQQCISYMDFYNEAFFFLLSRTILFQFQFVHCNRLENEYSLR